MDQNKVEQLRKNFMKKGYGFDFFSDERDAVKFIVANVPEGKSVAFGGSMTLEEIGLYDALRDAGHLVVWHWKKDVEDPVRKARSCDYYISGTNGVSEEGHLVNIDGNGNRVSALSFGHEKVFVVVGTNKFTKTLEEAEVRARTIAAPLNAQRFDIKTPCKGTKKCFDCNSPDRICRIFSVIERCPKSFPIHVIVIDKELGY